MQEEIFTVYDSAAKRFLTPFFAPTVEFALRGFREAVNQRDHQFNKFPEDYTLFKIGSFNPEDGSIEAHSPQSLGVAITMMSNGATDYVDIVSEVTSG